MSLGSFLSKVLGAIYRFPLIRLIGTEQMGMYQMIYPVYALLLTFSSVGLPSALSYLIASGKDCMKMARRIFLPVGAMSSVLLCAFAYPVSLLQGNRSLVWGYFAISPSLVLVTEISLRRGEFQGHGRMLPTAVSQVVEQAVKILFGLSFAKVTANPFPFLLLSVTLGECVALGSLLLWRRERTVGERMGGKELLTRTIPVTLSACVLPLSSFLDSVVLVRLAGVSQYGILSGCVSPLVALSSSVCVGISGAVIPCVAAGEKGKIKDSLVLTFICAMPVLLGFMLGVNIISTFLYGLSGDEGRLFTTLLLVSLPSCLFLPLVQTMAGCLTGLGKAEVSAVSLLVGIVAKLLFQLFFVPKTGISGGAISFDLCYLVAFFSELMYSMIYKENCHVDHRGIRRSGRGFIRTCKKRHFER